MVGDECFSALWEAKWVVGLAALADSIVPGNWRGMITCLERILAEEPERKEAPDSNQDWALMFLNRSVIHLIESFLKKESSLEQARLEERRAQREGDADWLGIKLLREELGWNLVDENEEG